MDRTKKKKMEEELAEMEKHLGRMLRNMSLPRMGFYLSGRGWCPSMDVYETETAIVVYIETAGIDPAAIVVTAESMSLTVQGSRQLPLKEEVRRIHQLEIDHGGFTRTLQLPAPIDVQKTTSSCKDGLLEIRLPKLEPKGKIEIAVS